MKKVKKKKMTKCKISTPLDTISCTPAQGLHFYIEIIYIYIYIYMTKF